MNIESQENFANYFNFNTPRITVKDIRELIGAKKIKY